MSWLERLFKLYYAREIVENTVRTAQLHGMKAYIQAVQKVRVSALGLVALLLATFVTAMGAVALLAGLFLLLPLENQHRLYVLTGVGAVLFFGPVLTAWYVFREPVWVEKTGIQRMIAEITAEARRSAQEANVPTESADALPAHIPATGPLSPPQAPTQQIEA